MRLSILVTAYNAQTTIQRCLDSLLNQSAEGLEIIVVDDGSTDQTPQIVDDYAKNTKIRVIHQPNGGVSKARNTALNAAAGEYITYLDSDDFAVADIYKELLHLAETAESDILVYDAFFDWGSHQEYFDMGGNAKEGSMTPAQFVLSEPCPWNKLMRRSIFTEHDLQFEESMIYEDYALIPQLANWVKTITYLKKPCIHYWQSENSIMRGEGYRSRCRDILKASKILIEGIDLNRFHDETEFVVYEHMLQNSSRYFLEFDHLEVIDEIASMMKVYFPKWNKNPYIIQRSKKERLIGWLFYNHQAKLVKKLVASKQKIRSEVND